MNSTNKYQPFLKPIVVNCYAVVIETGKAGKVGNKYRDDSRKITWGIEWAAEYKSSELCRITPAEFHALPEEMKISATNRGDGHKVMALGFSRQRVLPPQG